MTINQIKDKLNLVDKITIQLPDGSLVPSHFHVTEVGKVTKHFVDCGGVVRKEEVANFQLWEANDYDHRLNPDKLMNIIEMSQKMVGIEGDLEIEVEYQAGTIGKFGLDVEGNAFILTNKKTACLAQDACGVPENKVKFDLASMTSQSCTPGGGCC